MALARRLQSEKDLRVTGLSRRLPADSSLFSEFLQVDLSVPGAAQAALQKAKPDWIFHLAGMLKGAAAELMEANEKVTRNLLEAAASIVPTARFLLVGSAAEYGSAANCHGLISEEAPCEPETAYGRSKASMTSMGLRFARESHLRVNIARTFNLIGPGIPSTLLLGALIERVQEAIRDEKNSITVGEISAERDFIDVRDAVEAYFLIMKSECNGEIFNVCSGIPTRIRDLVEAALRLSARPIGYEVNSALARAGAASVVGNPAKLRKLGFKPRFTIQQSLADSCASFASR